MFDLAVSQCRLFKVSFTFLVTSFCYVTLSILVTARWKSLRLIYLSASQCSRCPRYRFSFVYFWHPFPFHFIIRFSVSLRPGTAPFSPFSPVSPLAVAVSGWLGRPLIGVPYGRKGTMRRVRFSTTVDKSSSPPRPFEVFPFIGNE